MRLELLLGARHVGGLRVTARLEWWRFTFASNGCPCRRYFASFSVHTYRAEVNHSKRRRRVLDQQGDG